MLDRTKAFATLALTLVLLASPAASDPAREAAAVRLLEVTELAAKTRDLYRQQMAQIVGRLQRQRPDLPGRAFDILDEEFDAIAPEVTAEMMATAKAMYAERFTAEEMHAIADFYATDVGKKALREMRSLAVERAAKGQEIGRRLGRVAVQRAIERINAAGIDMSPKPPR